jgi:S-DNA-T family DNA segregation ATPase FtsK/SpoIIIE
MSTYRQIRRQTRRARRAGLQPIVVIDSGLPVPAAVIIARLAWRYRSEIAPATTAGAVLAAGWWLHHEHASQWPWLLAASDLSAAALTALGARIGLARLAERVYTAIAVLTAGGWLAVAALLGPLSTPMPQVLAAGTFLLAVPGGRTAGAAPGPECSARCPPGPTSLRRSAFPVPRSSRPA